MVDYEEELDRYLDEIKELARSKQYARLRDLFLPMEPADIALLLAGISSTMSTASSRYSSSSTSFSSVLEKPLMSIS